MTPESAPIVPDGQGPARRPTAGPAEFLVSPPVEDELHRFWSCGVEFYHPVPPSAPPEEPLAILRKLGPSPFARGDFPVVGFLASIYDRVSQCLTADRPEGSTGIDDRRAAS